jgi:mannitol-1-/sugar-/sorbitol-6-/2-deoxyglucose-6-phosphatase
MISQPAKTPIAAVIFDMDGILIDSEITWQQVREEFAASRGKLWSEDDQRHVMGGSTLHWANYMKERLVPDWTTDQVIDVIRGGVRSHYERRLPLLPGALEAVQIAASAYKVGLASGSESSLIDFVLEKSGLNKVFHTVVYGDTLERGKPAPDIYLEAARRLDVAPEQCVGIEDSANGIRSLHAAGMRIIAVPGKLFPLAPEILSLAHVQLESLEQFSIELLKSM